MRKGRKPTVDQPPNPPRPPKRPVTSRLHGVEVTDDYAWLKDPNWRQVLAQPSTLDPEIRAHLEAENEYAAQVLAETKALQRRIANEIYRRDDENEQSIPERDGAWFYYSRSPSDAEHELRCRHLAAGGPEEIILDGNEEAGDDEYWDLGEATPSPDHRYLAFTTDRTGAERYTLQIRNLETGDDLPEKISGASSDIAWANDSTTLFYVRLDGENRPLEVWRHTVGSKTETDVLVFREPDAAYDVTLARSQSRDFIFITSQDHQSSEVSFLDASRPTLPPRRVAARDPSHNYAVEHYEDRFVILTNSDGAADGRICTGPIAADAMADWQELIPHRPGHQILELFVLERYLVRLEQIDANARVIARAWEIGVDFDIGFDGEGYALEVDPGLEYNSDIIRLSHSNMTTPERTYDYDLGRRQRTLRQADKAGRSYVPSRYVTQRIYAPAHDGAQVPVTLLYRRDRPVDGTAPVFLHGYGSYGDSMETDFSSDRISLVDRHFLYAIAHVRGGGEKGAAWYAAGRHHHKPNSFRDFISAAEHLVNLGLTSPGRIVAFGESAGGALVAAAVNLAPELFLGVIAEEPFVDVLNTLLDPNLALTPGEWPEWGNPIESSDDFRRILSFSPYENVAARPYPAILATGGVADQRVPYWEPAKWVARLREHSTSGQPVILHTNMMAGHAGGGGQYGSIGETARGYAFAIWLAERDRTS